MIQIGGLGFDIRASAESLCQLTIVFHRKPEYRTPAMIQSNAQAYRLPENEIAVAGIMQELQIVSEA